MNVIEVDDIVKRYGDRAAVDGVSFSVEEGEIFAILGPNGAGKTTTVESIAGLRTPDSGTITVLGLDPRHDRDRSAPTGRRPAPGEPAARSAPRLGGARPLRVVLRAPGRLGAAPRGPRPGRPARQTAFGKLSGGQKQRLSIALALVGNPRIAILDELTTGLDPQARRDTWELIEGVRDRGVTVVLVTHFMEEAERLADRIARDRRREGRRPRHARRASSAASTPSSDCASARPCRSTNRSSPGLPEVRSVDRSRTGPGRRRARATSSTPSPPPWPGNEIVANDLRIEQADLDDAFIALTGRRLAS